MTRIAIDLVGGKLTNNIRSHKNGWAHMRAKQLSDEWDTEVVVLHNKESWDDYDVVYLYHGMEFKGALNLFGGAKEESAKFFERLVNPKCKLISLDIPMPDYGELCKGRLKSCDDYWRDIDWDAVTETCKNVKSFYSNTNSNSLTMGDSHAFAAWKPGSMILRKDSRTLKGVLRKTLRKEIEDAGMNPEFSHLTLYYGNIDVRHHIMREEDPRKAIALLLIEYIKQIKDLNPSSVELVSLLPVEDESRKLPKTGQFEGSNFYGTQAERANLVRVFNNGLKTICLFNGWDLYEWPEEWYDMSPLEYMKECMERPKSVHLAPMLHRTNYWPEDENDKIAEKAEIASLVNF